VAVSPEPRGIHNQYTVKYSNDYNIILNIFSPYIAKRNYDGPHLLKEIFHAMGEPFLDKVLPSFAMLVL